MSTAIERLKTELTSLSVDERAELAHFLILTLDAEPGGDVEDAWETEVIRRVDAIKEGTAEGVPADELFNPIKAKRL